MPSPGWVTAVVFYASGHLATVTFVGVVWNSGKAVIQSGAGVSAGAGGQTTGGQAWRTSNLAGFYCAGGTQIYIGWTRASGASMEFSTNNGGTGYVASGGNPGSLGTLGAPGFGHALGAYIVYTPVGAPTNTLTNAPTSVASTTATLNGTTHPNGMQTTWNFQWGLTTGYGNTSPGGSVGTNGGSTGDTPVSDGLTGLTPGATYHYRIAASNAVGTTYGADQQFTTNGFPNPPTLTAPLNGAALSLWQNGGTFTWTYNTGGAGGGQTQYAFRRIEYPFTVPLIYTWWTGSGWSTTETWIVSSTGTLAIAGSNWGSTVESYYWSVNTKDANGTGTYASNFLVINEIPPAAPALNSPANASYADIDGTPTFSWTYNPTNAVGGQTSYAFRRKISGAGSYLYWNAGSSSWQSGLIANALTTGSVTFPTASWTNGNTYNWSVQTFDAGGQGPFAADSTVVAQAPPTVSVIAPTGTITSLKPVVAWSVGWPSGAGQTAYQVRTFTAAQYGIGGFNAATSPATDDSGVVGGTAPTYQVATSLPIGALRAYANITETGGITNGFDAFSGFTTAVNLPNAPVVIATDTVDGVTGCPMIQITAQCEVNLVSAVDSSFESGIGTFVGTNCALAQSATQFLDGAFALRLTASSAADMSALSGQYAVSLSTQYTAVASFRSAVTARTVVAKITWYDASHVLISTSTGTGVADTTSGWTQASVTATSPSNAAYAAVVVFVTGPANAEIHYVDNVGIFPGTNVSWSLGGFLATAGVIITRSDGVYIRNASPTNPALLSAAPTSQLVTVNDYEPTPLQAYTYTAVIQATGATGVVQSNPSNADGASVSTTKWWELDPNNPAGAASAQPITWNPSNTEQSTAHQVLGQQTAYVYAYAMQNTDMTSIMETFDQAVYTKFLTLALSQQTVFFSSPFGTSYYFRIAPSPGGGGSGSKAHDTQLLPSTSANPHQTLAITGIAQPRPAV